MSVEQAKAFIEKLDSDQTFLVEVAAAVNDEARLELAKAAGFDFTAEELASAMKKTAGEELSEDELEAVAGGTAYLKLGDIEWKIEEGVKFNKKFTPGLKW